MKITNWPGCIPGLLLCLTMFAKEVKAQNDPPTYLAPETLWQKSISVNSAETIFRTGVEGDVLLIGKADIAFAQPQNQLYRFSKEGKQLASQTNFAPGLAIKDLQSCFHNGQWMMAADSQKGATAIIASYSSSMKLQWRKTFDSTTAYTLATDAANYTYAVLSSTKKTAVEEEKGLLSFDLVCLDAKGKLSWQKTFWAEGDFLRSVKLLPMDSLLYLAVNTTILRGPDHHDLHLMVTDKKGGLLGRRQFTGASQLGDVSARSLIIGPYGKVHLAAISTDSLTAPDLAGAQSFQEGEPFAFTMRFGHPGFLHSFSKVAATDRFNWPFIELLWRKPDKYLVAFTDAETGDLLVSSDIFLEDKTKNICRLPATQYGDEQQLQAGESKGSFYLLKHRTGNNFWELIKMKVPE